MWALSQDGEREYFAGVDGQLDVIETRSRTVLQSFEIADSHIGVRDIVLAGDESSVVVLVDEGKLKIIELASATVREIPVSLDAMRLGLSSDGRRAMLGNLPMRLNDAVVTVVDLADGTVITSLPPPEPGMLGALSRMEFDSIRERAYVPARGSLLVFDFVVGGPARVVRLADEEIPVITDNPDALAIAADGGTLFMTTQRVGRAKEPRLYAIDTQSLAPIARLDLTEPSKSIVLDDERGLLYLADQDRCFVKVVDIDRWEVVDEIEVLDEPQRVVLRGMTKDIEPPADPAPNPPSRAEGSELCAWVTHTGGEVAIIDVEAETRLGFLHTGGSRSIAFQPDGVRAHIIGTDNSVTTVETANYREVVKRTLGVSPTTLVSSPDGELLLVGTINSRCHDVIALSGDDNSVLGGIGCRECSGDDRPSFTTLEVRFAPDGRLAYTQTQRNDTYVISIIDTATLEIVDSIPLEAYPGGFDLSPDGSRLYVSLRPSSGASSVAEYDTATRSRVGTISLVGSARNAGAVRMHPAGEHFYVRHTRSNESVLSIVDVASRTVTASLEQSGGSSIGFSRDGSKALLTSAAGVAVLNTATNEILRTIPTAVGPLRIAIAEVPGGCTMPPVYCVGDCNGDDVVTVDELITGVTMALGGTTPLCRAFEGPDRGVPTVETLVAGVSSAIGGCGSTGLD